MISSNKSSDSLPKKIHPFPEKNAAVTTGSAKPKSVIIGGIAKNIEKSFPDLIQNLDNIKSVFDSSITFLVIDENDDNTENLLKQYAETTDNTYLFKISNSGHRTERIANARNKVLEVSEPYLDKYQFFLTFDLDFKKIPPPSIVDTLKSHNSWDVATANTPGYYYDRWALRTKESKDSCWKNHKDRNCDKPLSMWLPNSLHEHQIPTDTPPIEVISAFGGLAIYKNNLLKQCRQNKDCNYSGNCEKGEKCSFNKNMDCEHVHFHKKLTEYTGAKVMIWPSLTVKRH